MAFEKAHMLRCASSFVTAAYEKVGLIPHDSRALPLNFLKRHHSVRLSERKIYGF